MKIMEALFPNALYSFPIVGMDPPLLKRNCFRLKSVFLELREWGFAAFEKKIVDGKRRFSEIFFVKIP